MHIHLCIAMWRRTNDDDNRKRSRKPSSVHSFFVRCGCAMGAVYQQIIQGRTIVENVAIVIAGHDAYAGAWLAMMHGLKTYWPDCPWPIYWITNRAVAPEGCITVRVGGDFNPKKWSDRMKRGLKQVPVKTLLWLLDDHWITAKPDVGALRDFAKLVNEGYIDRLRLYPGLDHDFGKTYSLDGRLIIMDKKSPYRCSCKPSFWDRKVLLSLLRNGESPWDFERDGRKRSGRYIFAATKDWHFYFVTRGCPDGDWPKSPIVKGKLTVSAKRYYEREGLKFNLEHPIEGNPFGSDIPDCILP